MFETYSVCCELVSRFVDASPAVSGSPDMSIVCKPLFAASVVT